jgi:hypothetical protein
MCHATLSCWLKSLRQRCMYVQIQHTLLGFGTWTAFGAGRVMVGLNGSGDALFDTA